MDEGQKPTPKYVWVLKSEWATAPTVDHCKTVLEHDPVDVGLHREEWMQVCITDDVIEEYTGVSRSINQLDFWTRHDALLLNVARGLALIGCILIAIAIFG